MRRLFVCISALSLLFCVTASVIRAWEPDGMRYFYLTRGDPKWALGLYEGRIILCRWSVREWNPADRDVTSNYVVLWYARITEGRWEQERVWEFPSLGAWIFLTSLLPITYVVLRVRSQRPTGSGVESDSVGSASADGISRRAQMEE